MGQIKSAPITISILAPSSFNPPYALPGPNQALGIGVNSAYDITPSSMATNLWSYSLFNSWSCGTLVEDYSAGGAWVIANSGGHGAPANIGAAIFDFTDAKWKRLDPQGADYRNDDWSVSGTSGAPYYEINGSNGVPAPSHTNQTQCLLPRAWVGTARSAVIMVTRGAVCNESVISPAAHKVELNTNNCVWSRSSNNLAQRTSHDCSAVIDIPRKRWWLLTNNQNAYNNHMYLDANDWSFKLTQSYPYPPGPMESGRIWMHQGLLMRQSRDGKLYAWDPDNQTVGWKVMNVNGILPSNTDAFCYFPINGKYYHCSDSAGATLTRLTPPSLDPWNGAWNLDTVTLSTPLPPRTVDGGPDPYHINSLFYVPAIKRMAWVPGGSQKVFLLNPT